MTQYAHLSKTYVKEGQTVTMKQVIGGMGNTGFSTGTHLHLSVSRGPTYAQSNYIDPCRSIFKC